MPAAREGPGHRAVRPPYSRLGVATRPRWLAQASGLATPAVPRATRRQYGHARPAASWPACPAGSRGLRPAPCWRPGLAMAPVPGAWQPRARATPGAAEPQGCVPQPRGRLAPPAPPLPARPRPAGGWAGGPGVGPAALPTEARTTHPAPTPGLAPGPALPWACPWVGVAVGRGWGVGAGVGRGPLWVGGRARPAGRQPATAGAVAGLRHSRPRATGLGPRGAPFVGSSTHSTLGIYPVFAHVVMLIARMYDINWCV